MDPEELLREMTALLAQAGVEIRKETFERPPKSGGGLCKIHGRELVLLHAGASRAEQSRALLEVVEGLGLEALGLCGSDLSPELLSALNRRGNMTWPHKREAPSIAKTGGQRGSASCPPRCSERTPPRLSNYTTLKLGGRPRQFVEAVSDDEVVEATRAAQASDLQLYPLGGGSNVVVSDDGVPGLVMRLAMTGVEVTYDGDTALVTAAAGENWHDFAAQMTEEGLAGLECLGGIPGSVGATPIQNVGAYGQEVSETITRVRVLDRDDFSVTDMSAEDCAFVYRGSVFKGEEKDRYVVLSVTYRLRKGGPPKVAYGELARAFEAHRSAPTLGEVFRTVLSLRKNKSMVYDPTDPNHRSCGSFFVNAQVPAHILRGIADVAGQEPPQYPGENGLTKIPSAWLIEKAGLTKGFSLGHAGLSSKHTLSLVAHDGALAEDIVALARHVRDVVEQRFSVRLIPEPHFWGFAALEDGLPGP